MQLTITEKKDLPLAGRVEVQGTITFDAATPSNVDVAGSVAKQLNADLSLVVVKHIYTQFGQKTATFQVVAYKDAAARTKGEVMTGHLRKKLAEKQKAAGA